MSILDIFRSAPAQEQQPAPQQQPQQQQPADQQANTQPAPQQGTEQQSAAAPLDAFSKLWETDATQGQADQSLFGTIDPKKIFEAAKGANFAGNIPQETLTAIVSGGEGAVKALQDALNHVTQATFAQNTLASTKLIEQAVTKALSNQMAQLPGLIKQHAVSDALHNKNPALAHPSAQPIIKAIEAQIAMKHPNATATELTKLAEDYLGNFASMVTAPNKQAAATTSSDSGEVDWTKYLQ